MLVILNFLLQIISIYFTYICLPALFMFYKHVFLFYLSINRLYISRVQVLFWILLFYNKFKVLVNGRRFAWEGLAETSGVRMAYKVWLFLYICFLMNTVITDHEYTCQLYILMIGQICEPASSMADTWHGLYVETNFI